MLPTELTARNIELLHLIADGYTQAKAAAELGVTEKAVNNMLFQIRQRLDVPTTADAIRMVQAASLLPEIAKPRQSEPAGSGAAADCDYQYGIRGRRRVRGRHGIVRWEQI